MGKSADETQDDAQKSPDPMPSPAIESEAREGATPGADDDEYEMVELSELVDVPKAGDEGIADTPPATAAQEAKELMAQVPLVANAETPGELVVARPPEREPSRPSPLPRHSPGLLPPPVRVTKSLPTSSASIPPPPGVPSRTLPPPPLRTSSTSLPPTPRSPISSPPDFTISGTVPPLAKPSKNRFERALSGRQAAAAAVLVAICAAGYFGAKRGEGTTSDPSREVAAANLPAKPPAPPETIAIEPAANMAAVPTEQAPETKPAPSLVAAEPKKVDRKTEAPRAEPLETEVPKAGAQKSAPTPAACTLNLNTIPASRVAIDGRDLGMTPKIGVSVEPGTHVVMFAHAGGKKVTSAQCKAGEQKTVVVRLPI